MARGAGESRAILRPPHVVVAHRAHHAQGHAGETSGPRQKAWGAARAGLLPKSTKGVPWQT